MKKSLMALILLVSCLFALCSPAFAGKCDLVTKESDIAKAIKMYCDPSAVLPPPSEIAVITKCCGCVMTVCETGHKYLPKSITIKGLKTGNGNFFLNEGVDIHDNVLVYTNKKKTLSWTFDDRIPCEKPYKEEVYLTDLKSKKEIHISNREACKVKVQTAPRFFSGADYYGVDCAKEEDN